METATTKPIRDTLALMALIERAVQFSSIPLTGQDVYEKPEIRARATDADHVSRTLSNLYKTKRIGRVPYVRKGSNVRFAYTSLPKKPEATRLNAMASAVQQQIIGKASIAIRQSGGLVVIELPQLTITIETK